MGKLIPSALLFFISFLSCSGDPLAKIEKMSDVPCTNREGDSQLGSGMDSTGTATKIGATVESRPNVNLPYVVHEPPGDPIAVLVVIPGGEGKAFTGSGASLRASQVFLIKNADVLTEAGFKVVSVSMPSDMDSATNSEFYAYRVSVKQSVDIAQLLTVENKSNKPVLLAGTSRGTIALIPNSALALGVAFSSTSSLVAGSDSSQRASSLSSEAHILQNSNDLCSSTSPANANFIYSELLVAGKSCTGDMVSGGFEEPGADPCGPQSYHGYYGIENCATQTIVRWANGVLEKFATNNLQPKANAYHHSSAVVSGNTTSFSLANSASDPNGDTVAFAVPFETSMLGGSVSITTNGQVVYMAPNDKAGYLDMFVYVVNDSLGGRGRAVVTIAVQ
ncbi:MAG TPA: Ig-like domain-containing protein [Nitrospinota bacterium]|nr:Ig-like domain-containing protein [Nitrospinota bacterium]|tara:strand:- start:42827 stop:44002 length:1176 start_codon:yes stop_codon:yes gene_type:complete